KGETFDNEVQILHMVARCCYADDARSEASRTGKAPSLEVEPRCVLSGRPELATRLVPGDRVLFRHADIPLFAEAPLQISCKCTEISLVNPNAFAHLNHHALRSADIAEDPAGRVRMRGKSRLNLTLQIQ